MTISESCVTRFDCFDFTFFLAMEKILIINGGSYFPPNWKGALNTTLSEEAAKYLKSKGHEVQITKCDTDYNIQEEVEKVKWADVLIWQFPVWWMQEPWQVTKYMDEVYMSAGGILFTGDGRTRSDPTKKYGTGGLPHNKKYMLSTTWNAPIEAFTDPDGLFEGKGIDYPFVGFRKAHQSVGMKPLPSFICNDVVKNLNIPKYIEDLHKHLDMVFEH